MRALKPILKKYNKQVFGNVPNVTKSTNEVNMIQGLINDIIVSCLTLKEKNAQILLDKALDIKDQFWRDMMRNK